MNLKIINIKHTGLCTPHDVSVGQADGNGVLLDGGGLGVVAQLDVAGDYLAEDDV